MKWTCPLCGLNHPDHAEFPIHCGCGFKFVCPECNPIQWTTPRSTVVTTLLYPRPGSVLKRKLANLRILPKEADGQSCGCEALAEEMDVRGPDWCRLHISKILDHMENEAAKRGLLFFRKGAEILVKRAINEAEKYPE